MGQESQLKDDVAQEACRHGSVRAHRLNVGSMLQWVEVGGLKPAAACIRAHCMGWPAHPL